MTDRNRTAADELAMALRGMYFMALQKIEPGSVLMSATRDALKRYADEQMARAGVEDILAQIIERDAPSDQITCADCGLVLKRENVPNAERDLELRYNRHRANCGNEVAR